MTRRRALLLAALVAAAAFVLLGGPDDRSGIAQLKLAREQLVAWRAADPLRAGALFYLLCAGMTGLPLPVAGITMLAAGAIFGLWWGTALALSACATGATLAFLAARHLFRDAVEARLGDRLAAINRGLAQDGALYLFFIRLTLVFPFFVVNPLMALTRIGNGTFVPTTIAGLVPSTLIFVNAGTELARIETPGDIVSPGLVVSLALIGVFPLAARKTLERLRR